MLSNILTTLGEYQRTHRAFFMDGVPRLCKSVPQQGPHPLRGVGIAVEPPAQHGRPISYGKSRTTVIFKALDEVLGVHREWWTLRDTGAQKAKRIFVETVAGHLKKAGIDPAQVHL